MKVRLFFVKNIFFLKLIFKKLTRYFKTPIFEGASLGKRSRLRRLRLLRSQLLEREIFSSSTN